MSIRRSNQLSYTPQKAEGEQSEADARWQAFNEYRPDTSRHRLSRPWQSRSLSPSAIGDNRPDWPRAAIRSRPDADRVPAQLRSAKNPRRCSGIPPRPGGNARGFGTSHDFYQRIPGRRAKPMGSPLSPILPAPRAARYRSGSRHDFGRPREAPEIPPPPSGFERQGFCPHAKSPPEPRCEPQKRLGLIYDKVRPRLSHATVMSRP